MCRAFNFDRYTVKDVPNAKLKMRPPEEDERDAWCAGSERLSSLIFVNFLVLLISFVIYF